MIDNRSQRSPNINAFDFSNPDSVVFDPGPTHSILGPDQMEWLLRELSNSTATWKFISSGTPINPAWPITIELALLSQGIIDRLPVPGGGYITPVEIAIELADKWGGFPADMIRILEHIHDNQIENVIFLSGDTHTSGIDNGQNSILPELMAGGLDRTNGQLLRFFSLFGVEIWNSGGHTPDLPEEKFGNAYGRVTVFNDDSVALEAVAEGGEILGRHVVQDGILPSGSGAAVAPLIAVDFGSVPVGETATQSFVIASISFDSLHVTDISVVGDTLITVDFNGGKIAPADKQVVHVNFAPHITGDTSFAEIRISTNDPDNALFSIQAMGRGGQSTSIVQNTAPPHQFRLYQNFPNPFNSSTLIRFSLTTQSAVTLDIFNVRGQHMVKLIDGQKAAGLYTIRFDAKELPSGIYYYRLKSKTFHAWKKMILLK